MMVTVALMILLLPFIVLMGGVWFETRRSPYPFGIGQVLSNGFVAIGGAPLAFLVASLVLNVPAALMSTFAMGDALTRSFATGTIAPVYALLALPWFVVSTFVQLFMTGLALDTLAGRRIDLPATLAMAGRRLFPALVVIILFAIAAGIGFVLLVVPGVVLMLTWFVVMPVIAGEGAGILDSFGRSRELMRGVRWRLLLLVVIIGVLWTVFNALTYGLSLAIGGVGGVWTHAVVQAVASTLTGMFPAAGIAAVYHEARMAKGGMDHHDLDAVFA